VTSIYDDVGQIQQDLVSGSYTDDTTPLVRGTITGLEAGDRIFVEIIGSGGSVIRSGNASVTGSNWEFAVTPALAVDGNYQIRATVYDRADNAGSVDDHFSFILDTVAPTDVINKSDLDLHDDVAPVEGTIKAGDETDDNTPTFSGSAGSVNYAEIKYVNIYDNGVLIGTADVLPDGSWSFEPNPPIVPGNHNFQAAAVDAAGNVGPKTSDWDFKLVGAAPGEPAINRIDDNQLPKEGMIQKGGVTNDATPVLTGTGTAGSTVHVYASRSGGAEIEVGSVVVDGSGNWTIEVDALTQGDGVYTFRADATDGAGQRSSMSGGYDIILDTTAPTNLPLPKLYDNVGVVGDVAFGAVIDDNRPVISGTLPAAEAGAVVTVYVGSTVTGTAIVAADGTWSLQPSSPLGDSPVTPYQISYTVTDVAGNESARSTAFEVRVDTSALVVTLTEIRDNVAPYEGAIVTGVTNDPHPQFIGKANAGSTISVSYVNSAGVSVLVGNAVANASGDWVVTPTAALPDGSYNFVITGTSTTGNTSSLTASLEVDTTPPAVSIDRVVDDVGVDQTGAGESLASGAVTDDATPTFYGTSEAGATIEIKNSEGAVVGSTIVGSDGKWNININQLGQDGLHNLSVTATDSAGNKSLPVNYEINLDTTPKQLSANIVSITDDTGEDSSDFITSDQTLVISGTVTGTDVLEAGDRVQVRIDNGAWQLAQLDLSTGTWSFDNTARTRFGHVLLTVRAILVCRRARTSRSM